MPLAARTPPRGTIRCRIVAVAAVVSALLSGCGGLNDPGADATRGELVSDLAAQMSQSTELTYSASYRVAGGATATLVQAQDPRRAAYLHPGGKVTVTDDATTACRTTARKPTCTITAPSEAADRPRTGLYDGAVERGMVTPAKVLDLLSAAALDRDAEVTQTDTTIAGRHATCVRVDSAATTRFDTCITNEGVLGSFSGAIGGESVDVAMTRFQDTIAGDVFTHPASARVIDRR